MKQRKKSQNVFVSEESKDFSKKQKIKNILKDHWMILTALLLFLIFYVYFFTGMKYLPGPVYGGDVYEHFGEINHLYSGGSYFHSSQYVNEWAHYPRFSHFMISMFAKVTGLDILKATILMAIFENLAGGVIFYLIGLKLFDKKIYALLLSIISLASFSAITTPSSFSYKVFIPLIFLLFFYINNKKYIIPLGIIFGLICLEHVVTFLTFNLMLVFYAINQIITKSDIKIKQRIKETLTITIPIFFIAFAISLIHWFPILYEYHAKTVNAWQEYASVGVSGVVPSFFNSVIYFFFSFSGFKLIVPLLIITGLIYTIIKHEDENNRLILIFLLSFIVGYLHPVITKPLLNTSFGFYTFSHLMYTLSPMLIVLGAYVICEKIKNFKPYKNYIFALIILQIFVLSIVSISATSKDTWISQARKDNVFMDKELSLGKFIKENTNVYDVILTPHGETSFAVNAISGRKIVFMRRTHASPFVDANKREADAAVMLYGKNNETVKKLLNDYNVKYFLIDSYAFEESRKCMQIWDSLNNSQYYEMSYSCLRTSPEYEKYLNDNGIDTKRVYARQDIASNEAPKFWLIAIKPSETLSFQQDLEFMHKEEINGQPILQFFRMTK